MGNGFSKMLQKLSLDVKKESDGNNVNINNITIDDVENDEKRMTSEEYNKKRTVLPKVRASTNDDGKRINKETQMENEKLSDSLKAKNIGFNDEAKVVKIYKKIKNINTDGK